MTVNVAGDWTDPARTAQEAALNASSSTSVPTGPGAAIAGTAGSVLAETAETGTTGSPGTVPKAIMGTERKTTATSRARNEETRSPASNIGVMATPGCRRVRSRQRLLTGARRQLYPNWSPFGNPRFYSTLACPTQAGRNRRYRAGNGARPGRPPRQ